MLPQDGPAPAEIIEAVGRLQARELDLHLLRDAVSRIALTLGQPVDVWGFDSCFMQRAEVEYEMRGGVRLVVGSQDTVDGDGWDYDAWLSLLLDRPSIDGPELALAITRLASENADGQERNISCVNLASHAPVGTGGQPVRRRAGALRVGPGAHGLARDGALPGPAFRRRGGAEQRISGSGEIWRRSSPPASFPRVGSGRSAGPAGRACGGPAAVRRTRGTGISIYHQVLPPMPQSYRTLDFFRDTSWDDYLMGRPVVRQPSQPQAGRCTGRGWRRQSLTTIRRA